MDRDRTIEEIAAQAVAEVAAKKKRARAETPVNINTGTLTGGQHVNNVVITGDYIPGNKKGKKGKK